MKKFILILLFFSLSALNSFSQNKIALVIGNGSYAEVPLRNPVNDATDMASTLIELGFNVMLKTNLNRQQLEDAIRAFEEKINRNDIALFYFSGHGIQVGGLNYLVPIGAGIKAENEVRYNCTEAGLVLDKMESAGSSMNIIILDACRDNPFKGVRSGTKGFAQMSAPTGSIISYSTAPGSVAYDGNGRNSPYTLNLINTMKIQGLKIEDMFKKVRNKVAAETQNQQIPWESSSLMSDFYFNPGVFSSQDQTNNFIPNNAPTDQKNDYNIEMVFVKGGTFMMGSNDGEDDEKPVHQVTVSDFRMGKYEVTVAQFKAFIDATGYETDADKSGGSYIWTGTTSEKKSGVNWSCDAAGNIRPTSEYNHPVIHVSWNDAVKYCEWLSQKTGKNYRLPSEAEWEYAAGNGSQHTKYSWGGGTPNGKQGGNVADETAKAKFGWTGTFENYTDGFAYTAPVGSFNPNAFGLYDMTGNVWEWCSDRYGSDYYKSSPATNPHGPASGSSRVFRGGSWYYIAQYCRVANRFNYRAPGDRSGSLGFRLVLSL